MAATKGDMCDVCECEVTCLVYDALSIQVKSVGSSRRRAMDMYTILQKCFRYETRRLSDPNFKAKPRSLIVAGESRCVVMWVTVGGWVCQV